MKRIAALLLALAALLTFCACKNDAPADYDKEGYKQLLDDAILLPSQFTPELFSKVVPEGEIEYNRAYYSEKGQDYFALLQTDYSNAAAEYAEIYGEDWKLSYTINEVIEKDAEGIANYKDFDGFYFKTYNIDTDAFQAVTFVKVTVHIEGSKDQNDKDKTIQCFCIDNKWYSLYAPRLGIKL